MIRKCRYNLNILSYAESGFGFRESLSSEKHSSGEITKIIVLDKTLPKCFSLILNYTVFPYPF